MPIRTRTVRAHYVPEKVTATAERSFLRELKSHAQAERPRVVLDCSYVRDMDTATIHLLLSCLEEVMKCNGDVRLASLRPRAEAALRLAGVDILFEIYATPEAAVQSFNHHSASIARLTFETETLDTIANLQRDPPAPFGSKGSSKSSFEVKQ